MAAARMGRGRNIRLARRKPKSRVGQLLQDWHQDYSSENLDLASLGSGDDIDITVLDNSAKFTNSILKWSKITLRMVFEPQDSADLQLRTMCMAVLKEDQDDTGNSYAIDQEEVIRELRRDNKLVRGPWLIHPPRLNSSGFIPMMSFHMKPIVLKSFVMDREEDLVVAYTNLGTAFGATSQIIRHFSQGWVRAIK